MKKIGVLALFLLVLIPISFAQVDLVEFYGQGCPHCATLEEKLIQLEEKYPDLNVVRYEVYFDQTNREIFQKMASNYGTEIQGVPTVFINDKFFIGYSSEIGNELEKTIQTCLEKGCISPFDKEAKTGDANEFFPEQLTIPAVVAAAAVDAINPCAFAVLIILLSTILASSNKRKALLAGLAFTLSIFISYLLMGLGLYTAISATGVSKAFYFIVAFLAIAIGLFNLKDYFWYGKWFIMEVPLSWRPKMKALLRGVTSIPGAFLIGFLISLFLLPCTSGPYIVILGLLSHIATQSYAFWLLILYNVIFILPMLAITFAIYFGLTTERAERWRTKHLKNLHLIAGIIIILLGVGMLLSIWFGLI